MIEAFIKIYMVAFWFVPLVAIVKFHKYDSRFYFRQWLFPLQFLLQLFFERLTNNQRIAVRVLHVFSPIITTISVFILLIIVFATTGKLEGHYNIMMLEGYLLVSSIAFWFQPRAGKIYKTK